MVVASLGFCRGGSGAVSGCFGDIFRLGCIWAGAELVREYSARGWGMLAACPRLLGSAFCTPRVRNLKLCSVFGELTLYSVCVVFGSEQFVRACASQFAFSG